jgi:hypothetical protein
MKTSDWEATRTRNGLLARITPYPTWPDAPNVPPCPGCGAADEPVSLLHLSGLSDSAAWPLCRRCLTNLRAALDEFLATPER